MSVRPARSASPRVEGMQGSRMPVAENIVGSVPGSLRLIR